MDKEEKTQLEIHRKNMENPPYPGIRTKRELKDRVIMNNAKRAVEEAKEV